MARIRELENELLKANEAIISTPNRRPTQQNQANIRLQEGSNVQSNNNSPNS